MRGTLHLCRRNDAAVVEALYKTKTVDDVEALDKVTFSTSSSPF
jgi:hypothetical protein